MGCLLACGLHRQKEHQVWLLDHNEERPHRINHNLKLWAGKQILRCQVAVTADPSQIGPADIVLLCVKSGATDQALTRAAALFTDTTILIPLQNGISHLEVISRINLPGLLAPGVSSLGATLVAEGQVRPGGSGPTRIGFIQPPEKTPHPLLVQTEQTLNQCGFPTTIVDDIINHIWNKLLINVGINALTVIHDCVNGRLLDIAEARQTLSLAVQEGEEVAEALGISLTGDAIGKTVAVCRATANNVSSMLQDVRNKRPTEIMAINDALVKKGTEKGLDLPVNRDLVRRIKAIEAEYLRK